MAVTLSRLTREFVHWPITTTNDLTGATAEVAFLANPSDLPDESDWEGAELVEAAAGWLVRALVGPGHVDSIDLTPAGGSQDYQTWVRVSDEPERPVRRPGVVTVE